MMDCGTVTGACLRSNLGHLVGGSSDYDHARFSSRRSWPEWSPWYLKHERNRAPAAAPEFGQRCVSIVF